MFALFVELFFFFNVALEGFESCVYFDIFPLRLAGAYAAQARGSYPAVCGKRGLHALYSGQGDRGIPAAAEERRGRFVFVQDAAAVQSPGISKERGVVLYLLCVMSIVDDVCPRKRS